MLEPVPRVFAFCTSCLPCSERGLFCGWITFPCYMADEDKVFTRAAECGWSHDKHVDLVCGWALSPVPRGFPSRVECQSGCGALGSDRCFIVGEARSTLRHALARLARPIDEVTLTSGTLRAPRPTSDTTETVMIKYQLDDESESGLITRNLEP